MKRICVFCGSALGARDEYQQLAKQVGSELAQRKLELVYGGGSIGLMGVLADQCIASGGRVIGVIPHFLNKVEIAHQGLEELILVNDMFERKARMEQLSDGFLVLPGGFGTLDELFEMITLNQLNQHQKPLVLYNGNGYFTHQLKQIEFSVEQGFIKAEHGRLIKVAHNFDQIFSLLKLQS